MVSGLTIAAGSAMANGGTLTPALAQQEREMSVTALHNAPSRFPLPGGECQGEGMADHPLTRCRPEPAAGGRRIPPHLECFELSPST
jgi:hypothetical protein